MVYRVYVEKKPSLALEAAALKEDLTGLLQISGLEKLRLINRYDVEHIDRDLFEQCKATVFSEPQLDVVSDLPETAGATVFAVEYLPGQFDQRADSAAQCIQIISQQEKPTVRTARVYLLYGDLADDEVERIKKYVINPVECREASLDPYETLDATYEKPERVAVVNGFCGMTREELSGMVRDMGLAMDEDDIAFCQQYFQQEQRDPTITEIKMIDTYWSDHCRHTTFLTTLDQVTFEDGALEKTYQDYLETRKALGRTKPVNFMDLATLAGKYLKQQGLLEQLDKSEEINACTVKMKVATDQGEEDWLLLFKNETHNHPTEIEPFGGAATCIGGAIRDPLSGRSYVYAAMRVTGAADPLTPVSETLPGKLPQRKIVTTAAAGYSSYGNQIGLATGIVDEIYHPGYAAKRMEIGAVVGAAPAANVRRECPEAEDVVILLGGRTGRDGCGGATGSSKSHTLSSLESCGAEVQKGNAPEERKLQRLFRNPKAARLIKRCNDFGAGGVSVAIGELADGVLIDLNAVPKKYEGLDGTELAISESQERMAVVVAPSDAERFCHLAEEENLEATVVAKVTKEPRLVMTWNGVQIVNLSREFLNSNGAEKHTSVAVPRGEAYQKKQGGSFTAQMTELAQDLNVCSKRGLGERFDSTIGAGTVLMPFGGKKQRTPIQAMVHKIPVEQGETDTCSVMAWGYNPFITEKNPYHGAYLAVVESVSKLIAAGAEFSDVYLTFQEYFEKPGKDPKRWGQPMAALLGAFRAQKELGIAAIGGKDSMSGSFEQLDVPPTLCSFAITTERVGHILSPEFKQSGQCVIWLRPERDEDGLPKAESLKEIFAKIAAYRKQGIVTACYTPTYGGAAEAVMKMTFGNEIGFTFSEGLSLRELFDYAYGSFLLEVSRPCPGEVILGTTVGKPSLSYGHQQISLAQLTEGYEGKLESVFSCNISQPKQEIPTLSFTAENRISPRYRAKKPQVLIPVFPGTNCEYDTARVMAAAGAEPNIMVINNLTAQGISDSAMRFAKAAEQAQMIFIPGGFSGGDEPDGSGKFITAFFRNEAVKREVTHLLDQRDGLICGICNGFQALIKLGLVPYGRILEPDEHAPTLTYNVIGRHQSKLVRTRIASNLSPWLAETKPGEIYTVPISHGEGRFIGEEELIRQLMERGQIATQYVDENGLPSDQVQYNPNGSFYAIEGITSPDGRVFGKMGHSERMGKGLYQNVPGCFDLGMFRAAVRYFQ